MSIMAKTPSGYKKIGSAYLGERPVDKVFNANGDVVYALQRELTGVPPLLFKGKEQSELLNYRIYGDTVDGNSVGDLVESGQHAGEYVVPVTVEGKNLLPNTATSQEINGVTFTVNSDGSVTCNGTATQTVIYTLNDTFSLEPGAYKLTGCPAGGGYTDKYKLDIVAPPITYGTDRGYGSPFTLSSTLTNAQYRIIIYNNQTCDNLTFYPMVRKADIEDDTYEPYHAPVTTPIYLPEPIKMVGNEAEYIDYGEQKLHRVRKNLFNSSNLIQNINLTSTNGLPTKYGGRIGITTPISINGNVTLSYNTENNINIVFVYTLFRNDEFIGRTVNKSSGDTIQGENGDEIYIVFYIDGANISINNISNIMLNSGTEALPYEPYIENTDLDVTLPALPTIKGTNEMSVDTEVQPSRMDIKGRIKSLT